MDGHKQGSWCDQGHKAIPGVNLPKHARTARQLRQRPFRVVLLLQLLRLWVARWGSLEHWGKALDGRDDCSPLRSSSGVSSGGSDALTPPAPRAGTQLTWDVPCAKPVEGVDHNICDDDLEAEGGEHSSGVNAAQQGRGNVFFVD